MAEVPPELRWAGTHVTSQDLSDSGSPTPLADILDALSRISVYDCLRAIGELNAFLTIAQHRHSILTQQEAIDRVADDRPELHWRLTRLLNRGQIAIFERQLYHLARLALMHADLRPPDNFKDGDLVPNYLFALFGVTDQFGDDLGPEGSVTEDGILSFELRQTSIFHNETRLIQWSFYYGLFDRIWPQLPKPPDADEAFERYTGLTINEYLALGFAFSVGRPRRRGLAPRRP